MANRRSCITVKVVFLLSVLFSLAVFLNLCPCQNVATAGVGPVTENALQLRIMTFNILQGNAHKDDENRWENRRELVVNILRENQPDILGLQEALRFQLDQIRQGLGQYREIGVGRDDGKTQGEYCAILYRLDRFDVDESGTFWLCDTPEAPGSITWGNACTRICTWARFIEKKSRLAFYAFNLHLDHVSQPSREKSVVLLAKRIAGRKQPDPFIVTGDFNTGEDNPVILYLKGKKALDKDNAGPALNPVLMVDAFRVLHPDDKEVGTYNDLQGKRSAPKIDYIFASPDLEVLQAEILRTQYGGRWPSDHFPVTATLRLGTAGQKQQK
jgi:endonuclease/exonuclease/phosphatase family metal-dependent hydrolase